MLDVHMSTHKLMLQPVKRESKVLTVHYFSRKKLEHRMDAILACAIGNSII